MSKHRLRVCIGYNDDDTPIVKQIYATSEFELADRAAKALLKSERRKEFVGDLLERKAVPTFGEYAAEWMKTYKRGKLKPTTLKGYECILNSHFYPEWENTPLDRITTKSIQDFLCKKKHLSMKYLHDMRVFLSQIMESALRDEWITRNPATDSRLYNPSEKEGVGREALSMDEVKSIIPSLCLLDRMDRLYLALVIFTGMRRGEVLALRWEDIDLTENTISVQRNATYTNNQPFIGTPKTKNGFRTVPISPNLLSNLLPLGEKGYIISGGDPEKPLTLTAFRCMMKRINDTIDLCGATSHVFRHTIGTMLNDTGADVKTIQSILGQSDFKTTMDRYVHPRDSRKQEAIKNVSLLLQNGG